MINLNFGLTKYVVGSLRPWEFNFSIFIVFSYFMQIWLEIMDKINQKVIQIFLWKANFMRISFQIKYLLKLEFAFNKKILYKMNFEKD